MDLREDLVTRETWAMGNQVHLFTLPQFNRAIALLLGCLRAQKAFGRVDRGGRKEGWMAELRIFALWTEKNTSISPSEGKLHRVKIHHALSYHSSLQGKKFRSE